MINLNKCTGSCNVLFPKERKHKNVKAFNMIPNKTEAKAMTQHISCDCKCKFNSTTCNSKQKRNKKTGQYECKNYCKCKKDYSWNLSTCICENSKYLKGVTVTPVTECVEVIIVIDIVSIKKSKYYSNKKDQYYSNKCYEYYFNRLS